MYYLLLRLLAVENQSTIDCFMPCRLMLYDSTEYEKQLKELKKRNLNQGLLHTSAQRLQADFRYPLYAKIME